MIREIFYSSSKNSCLYVATWHNEDVENMEIFMQLTDALTGKTITMFGGKLGEVGNEIDAFNALVESLK